MAGVHNPVFTDDALEAIHDFTQGIARKTNNICTSCLLQAFAGRKNLVDDHLVNVILENEFSAYIKCRGSGETLCCPGFGGQLL